MCPLVKALQKEAWSADGCLRYRPASGDVGAGVGRFSGDAGL